MKLAYLTYFGILNELSLKLQGKTMMYSNRWKLDPRIPEHY